MQFVLNLFYSHIANKILIETLYDEVDILFNLHINQKY